MIDLHTHTYLCEHASGTPEEYIIQAIKNGIKIFGFADHAPMPEHLRQGISMPPEKVEKYIQMVKNLSLKYKSQIEIKTGFEVDFPLFDTFDKKYLTDRRIDYLIGSCHFLFHEWPFDHPDHIEKFNLYGIDNVYTKYYESIEALISSRQFNILGHFDVVKKFGHRPNKDFTEKIIQIAKLAAKTGIAVEINTAGLRKPVKEIYPSQEITKILFNANVPVTLGSDSHAPEQVGADFDRALEMIKKIGYHKIASFSKKKRIDINL